MPPAKQSNNTHSSRLESRVEALERLFENFVEQWRAERDELRTAIREQGETLLETWRDERKELQDAIRKQGEQLSDSWRSDRKAIFDELHNQSEEFKTQLREIARQMEGRRETTRGLIVQWASVGATFLIMAGTLIIFAVRSSVVPIETQLAIVSKQLEKVEVDAKQTRESSIRQESRLQAVERAMSPEIPPVANRH